MVSLTMLVISLVLFVVRVPVSISMGIATIAGFLLLPMPINVMATRMVEGVDGFALLAVPFFILAGNLMNAGGVTEKIFAFARALFGWIHGGLAQVNIAASIIFAGMSGSALADLAGLGAVEIRAMKSAKYPVGFSAAVTLASCTIGPLVPPSIVLVIYGLATNTSIGQLFLGGVFAGLAVAGSLMVFVYLYVRITGAEWAKPEPFVVENIVRTGVGGAPALFAPVIILGSLVLGVTTPSELGAIAAGYALLVGLLYRKFTWANLKNALVNTVVMTSVIMYLFAIASAMNLIVARERIAIEIAELMVNYVQSPIAGILLINAFLLLVGMFLEGPVAILIIAPILLEVVSEFGMGPVQFGIMLSFNLLIGLITPPVGIGLFVGAKVAGTTPEKVLRASVPFFVPLFFGLALISFVPAISTWLPSLVFGVSQ
ncbi:TRAP transporter large permease [Labrenzia sp. DG1229]|uniref:TRAP transporter large permease n=1 Tax=Labrenzia sp. DG1229 TaxID=681847 RepID=UPI00048F189B|nr:TRAP transporter large permease [Labrenzia sp. DG1229]